MTDTLAAALVALQAELPSVRKGRTAEVESKRTGGKYRYKYADLSDVSDALLPLLSKHGLAFIAKPTLSIDRFVLAYSLLHVSGEREDGEYPLPSTGTPQEVGSAITYARRYCLCAVTGVATEDDDGHAAGKASHQPMRQHRPAQEREQPQRTRTKTTGPEHERLVQPEPEERVNGRKADRTRGPIPDDENVWQGPPPNGTVKSRLDAIRMHFERLGVTDRGVRLGYVASITNHAVTTSKDLTEDEQKDLLAKLSKCRNHAALDQLAKQEVST